MAHMTGAIHAADDRTPLKQSPYIIDPREIIQAGFFATLFFSACYAPLFFMYKQDSLDLLRVLGSTVTLDEWTARAIGFILHLGVGIGIAASYAVILWLFNWQSNAGKGTVFGILVYIPMFAFFLPWFIGWLPKFAPTGAVLPPLDTLMNQVGHGNVGWEANFLVLAAHMMFGLMLGAMYRHKVRQPGTYRLEYAGG